MHHKKKTANIFTVFCVILFMTLICINSVDTQAKEVDNDKYSTIRHSENGFDVTLGLLQGDNGYSNGIFNISVSCVNNSGKDFSGTLSISMPIPDEGNKRTVNSYDVVIKAGKKYSIKTNISALGYEPSVNITLEDENSSLFDEDYALRNKNTTNKLGKIIYVLCDNPDGIDDSSSGYVFDNFDSIQKSTDYVAYKCDEDTFPDSEQEILDASCVLIANFDTSLLSDKQIEALKEYIYEGGNVVVATGKYYEKTLSGFKDIISYKINGTKQVKMERGKYSLADDMRSSDETYYAASYSSSDKEAVYQWDNFWRDYYKGEDTKKLSQYYKWTNDILLDNNSKNKSTKIACVYTDIDVDGGFVYGNGTYTSCSVKQIGSGYVYISGVDVSDGICSVDYSRFSLGKGEIKSGFGLASSVCSNDKISITRYIIIFIVYILFATVILYFILRKKGKNEYFWKIMPVIACIFAIVFLIMDKSYKREYTQCSYSEITELTSDGNGMKKTEIAILNADDGDYRYSIYTPSDISLCSFYSTNMDDDWYSYSDNRDLSATYESSIYVENKSENEKWKKSDSYIAIKNDTKKKDIHINGLDSSSVVKFRYKEKSSINGKFDLDFQKKDGSIIGKLVNNTSYDMKNVVIKVSGNYLYFIENIAANQSIEFSQNDFINGSLSNVVYNATKLDIDNFVSKKYVYTDSQMEQVKHLMGLCSNYNNIFNEVNMESCNNEVVVVGEWEGDGSFDSDWNGFNIVKQYVYCDSDISFAENMLDEGSADAIIGDTYRADDYIYDEPYYYSYLRGYEKVILLYDIPVKKEVHTIDVYRESDLYYDVSVKLYNYKEDRYDTIYNGKAVKDIQISDDYYGKNRPLRVSIENNEENDSDYELPKVCIKLIDKEDK